MPGLVAQRPVHAKALHDPPPRKWTRNVRSPAPNPVGCRRWRQRRHRSSNRGRHRCSTHAGGPLAQQDHHPGHDARVALSRRATCSNAEQCSFRVSKIAQSRTIRPSEIFGHLAGEVFTDHARQGSIGIDRHEKPPTRRKVAADRTGATDEVARIAAVNELSTANGPINIIQPNAPPATTNT